MKTVQDIADELAGTCQSLGNVLEKHDMEEMENNDKFCVELDGIVFCCECCDWWCYMDEMSEKNERICTDCEDC